MQYFISFLEGIITFISPCLLPMLPIYISFFVGEQGDEKSKPAWMNACSFVAGFTIIFILLGSFAGTLGRLFIQHQTIVNIVTGCIVILFGLNFMGVFHISILNRTKKASWTRRSSGATLWSSFLFGMVFSIGWTPCVGAFLGSALMMAAQQGSTLQGMIMLFVYSMGLGIPFVVSAVLIEQLGSTFRWIKQHYNWFTKISGAILIVVGIFMVTGLFQKLLAMLTI